MADDPIKQSRRAIDLYTADQFGRIDEKLKVMALDVGDLKQEVFGGHGQVGLGEQVRRVAYIIGGITTLISWFPWVYDHFISKAVNAPVFGEQVREKWVKQSTKRIRIFDKERGEWEYYYAIEESRDPKQDGS